MKFSFFCLGSLAVLASLAFQQCSDKCNVKRNYTYYEPVYSTSDEIKAATGLRAAHSSLPSLITFE